MITFLLTFLLAIMLVGVPILLCIALIGFIGIALIPELVMPLFAQKMFAQLDSFTLLAMPYFILAGSIMTAGGISRQLVDFARALVGHFRAGVPRPGDVDIIYHEPLRIEQPAGDDFRSCVQRENERLATIIRSAL